MCQYGLETLIVKGKTSHKQNIVCGILILTKIEDNEKKKLLSAGA